VRTQGPPQHQTEHKGKLSRRRRGDADVNNTPAKCADKKYQGDNYLATMSADRPFPRECSRHRFRFAPLRHRARLPHLAERLPSRGPSTVDCARREYNRHGVERASRGRRQRKLGSGSDMAMFCQTLTGILGLLKAFYQWPSPPRPHRRGKQNNSCEAYIDT
jgi:hypothetical protein